MCCSPLTPLWNEVSKWKYRAREVTRLLKLMLIKWNISPQTQGLPFPVQGCLPCQGSLTPGFQVAYIRIMKEMQFLGLHPRPTKSGSLGWRQGVCMFFEHFYTPKFGDSSPMPTMKCRLWSGVPAKLSKGHCLAEPGASRLWRAGRELLLLREAGTWGLAWRVLLAGHAEKNRVRGLLLVTWSAPLANSETHPWYFWGDPLTRAPKYLWTFSKSWSLQMWDFLGPHHRN